MGYRPRTAEQQRFSTAYLTTIKEDHSQVRYPSLSLRVFSPQTRQQQLQRTIFHPPCASPKEESFCSEKISVFRRIRKVFSKLERYFEVLLKPRLHIIHCVFLKGSWQLTWFTTCKDRFCSSYNNSLDLEKQNLLPSPTAQKPERIDTTFFIRSVQQSYQSRK